MLQSHRRRGIGNRVMQVLMQLALERGLPAAELSAQVRPQPPTCTCNCRPSPCSRPTSHLQQTLACPVRVYRCKVAPQ